MGSSNGWVWINLIGIRTAFIFNKTEPWSVRHKKFFFFSKNLSIVHLQFRMDFLTISKKCLYKIMLFQFASQFTATKNFGMCDSYITKQNKNNCICYLHVLWSLWWSLLRRLIKEWKIPIPMNEAKGIFYFPTILDWCEVSYIKIHWILNW